MHKLALISIIIPVFNESKVIGECLSSLLLQDYPNFEIIIVDDGSNDDSKQIINKFKVKYYRQDHQGPGVARNFGAKKSLGDILVFVDADMIFDKSFLSQLVKPIINNQAIGTFSRHEYLANSDVPLARCWNINRGLPKTQMHPLNYPNFQPVFRAIKKNEFNKVGGFTPRGYDDDYTLSEKLGIQAVSAPNAVFYHKNPENLSEIWIQAAWSARRKYKLGLIGKLITLVRTSMPFSIVIGIYKSISNLEPMFVVFKVVCDLSIFISIFKSFYSSFPYK